ncbi:uncharacterized protein LOC127871636 isoform X2 [Dreissena polymorpha]|uniref:uncharacterized protein LOC127852819 n=1 Tax=Dreissena polymorpha TaxID=45954 RepID=UPI002264731C|nr:uncharacterized protein LOC127852794 isoform X4 [Dreissena polymorpha]XP_052242769.1 uncharacterized protein LOC127852819 [Dreissena polymorpha]XP_052270713.1 uncharacterized protein LOC127871636 isoform X2 [Dreissena polymorpha]
MSHYNLRSRLSATLPPQLTPPTSPPDESTVPEQPLHPSTTISKQDTPKSSSRRLPHLATLQQTGNDRRETPIPHRLQTQEARCWSHDSLYFSCHLWEHTANNC